MSSVVGGRDLVGSSRNALERRERACAKPLPSLNALAADAGVVAADAGVVAVTRLHVRGKGRPAMEGVMRYVKASP